MTTALIISLTTIIVMIASILYFPKIKLGRIVLSSYWVITFLGLMLLFLFGVGDVKTVFNSLVANTAINPIKILVLFISMTILSVFLDEMGFFEYLALITLKKAKANKLKLFIYLYLIVSVLTVFTSNDIIILSFTPFICYFCKSAKINPLPFLAGEFVAANTWSMALIIGNPTNIYLCTAYQIGFIEYLKTMIVPTIFSGITALLFLFLLFRKTLLQEQQEGDFTAQNAVIKDKVNLIIGLVHLTVCTVLLAVSSYVGIEMWLVSLGAVISLFICVSIASLIRRQKPTGLLNSLKRAPYSLIPFVLSMFSIIIILSEKGITENIASLLGESDSVYKYGVVSFLSANLMNNIPMSVFFCKIIESLPSSVCLSAVYATVIGSNLGAVFTPIGALAGIMFTSILSKHDVKFSYKDFIKIGIAVTIPTLIVSLLSLNLIL